MFNCPKEFYSRCSNYIYKCKLCKAGEGADHSPLHYRPTDGSDIKDHPLYTIKTKKQVNKQKSKYTRKGLQKERMFAKDIAKQTLRSGAILQDGDLSILNGELNLDSKVRNTSSSFNVTKAEYQKGINQGLDGWVITNKDDESVVVLTQKAFSQLLALAKEAKENYESTN